MPSTRSGPHPRCHCHCHECGNKMAPDLGNLCPACKAFEAGVPSLGCSVLLAIAAVAVAASVWFL